MSTTGTEKHCRLCLMLSKGGTKACQYLLLKHVKEKPRDSEQNEWTLASFLNSKKENIIKAKLSKEQYKVLFPDTGDTVLSNWDLSLYCQVLTSYCGLKDLELLDIKQLRKTRNKLCHMNDAEIANLEFENKFEMIQAIIGRILEKVGDQDLKLEVDTIIKHLESGPLSMDETLKEMRKFYLMEMDIHEKLDHVKEKVLETHEKLDHVDETVLDKFERLDDKLEIINNKLDQRAGSGIDSATNNVLVPGVDIFLDLKNVSDEEEEKMSDILQQLFEEVINQNDDIKSSLPPNSYARLRKAVNETFHLFVSKGWRIKSAKRKCIKLHIKCSNFKSLADLFREHTNGKINNHLTDLNEALAECVNGEKSYIETIIYKGEFWNVLDKSISFVDIYLSVLNIDVAKQNDNVQPHHKDRRATLLLTAQNVKSENNASFERDCNNELNTCLQLLKSELQSEFHAPDLSIQASCSTNVNRETDDDDCDKTVITQRSIKKIGPTKGAHERGKYHNEEKKETREQDSLDQNLAMTRKLKEEKANWTTGFYALTISEKADREAANWTKGSSGLTITKNGLTPAVINILEGLMEYFTSEERRHLPKFLKNILEEETSDVNVEYINKRNNLGRSWKITGYCPCGLRLCQNILDHLCNLQVNNSKNVAWRPKAGESKLQSLTADKSTIPFTKWFDERCYICRDVNCPFQRNRKGEPLFDDKLSQEIVNIYWPLANMYMFRGNETNNFPNTRPEDTDTALFFRLMKNCKLFSIDEDDVDNGIYDELLEVRNILVYSPDNRLSDDALDECFDRMVKILKAKKFSNTYSRKAIKELEKLKDMQITMTTLTSEEATILVKQAFDLQQFALECEINVKGMLKNDYVLEDILRASKARREQYVGNAETGGATTAIDAVILAIGGVILVAAVRGLYRALSQPA